MEITEYDIEIAKQGVWLDHAMAIIRCFTAEGHVLIIAFFPPHMSHGKQNYFIRRHPLPYWPNTFCAFLCLSAEKYVWALDLLRNEKPIYAYLNPDTPDLMRIFKR